MKSDLFVFSLILSISRDVAAAADAEVVCEYNMNCILPCRFQNGSDIVIHWVKVEKTGKDIPVLSFMKEKVHPKEGFMNRTSLFMEEILNGNASVQLREVKIQDGGRYMCYASIFIKEQAEKSFINLKVNAPVRKVVVVKVKNVITCSSEGIYPEPELTWSNLTQQHGSTVQQDHLLLYSINSSVTLTDAEDNLDYYSCSVTTPYSSRKTTLFTTTHMNVSNSEYTLTCLSSAVNTKPLSHITWRFNSSEIIAERHGGHDRYKATSHWDERVKDVSESGDLTLRDLCADQTGTYTCEVSDARETYINSTFVRIQGEKSTISTGEIQAIVAAIFVVLVVVIGGVVWFVCDKKKKKIKRERDSAARDTELNHMMGGENQS